MYPERFGNQTNGVTPRRWLLNCNPELSGLITETIGDGWVTNLAELHRLRPARRGRRLPRAVPLGQAPGQDALHRLAPRPGRAGDRPQHDLRQPDQAHPRVQAPAAQRPALRRAVQPPAQQPVAERPAAHGLLRGQGGPGLHARQAHHQAHQQRRRRRRPRPGHPRPAQGRLPAELLRQPRRAADPRQRPVRADLDGRLRGVGHRQHEVHDERRADHRHARRRDHRDGPGGRRGELLPVRPQRRNRSPRVAASTARGGTTTTSRRRGPRST